MPAVAGDPLGSESLYFDPFVGYIEFVPQTLPSAHATHAQTFCISDDLAVLPGSGALGGLRVYNPNDTTKYARFHQVNDQFVLTTAPGSTFTFEYGLSLPAPGISFGGGVSGFSSDRLLLNAGNTIAWTASSFGSRDTSMFRGAAGVVGIGLGEGSGSGALDLSELRSGGTKVVGAQGAAVADAGLILLEVQTQLNALLARLRTHGLIAA